MKTQFVVSMPADEAQVAVASRDRAETAGRNAKTPVFNATLHASILRSKNLKPSTLQSAMAALNLVRLRRSA